MARYNVGDMVTVRPDLRRHVEYSMFDDKHSTNRATPSMLEYAGKNVVIANISSGQYETEELPGLLWTDEMFEDLCIKESEESDMPLQELLGFDV